MRVCLAAGIAGIVVAGLCFASATSAAEGQQATAAKHPNVIVILTDDQRWDTLSCLGSKDLQTPHIDRLAAEGVLFKNAFCTTALCSPCRASILSGLYAHTHGVVGNFTEYPGDMASFPKQLQKAGYETAYIGKWHMGEDNDDKRPGFDYFASHKGQGKYFGTEFNIDGKRQVLPGYYTHVVTKLALDWLAQPHAKPTLLMLGHKAPHSFYIPEPKYEHAFDKFDYCYPRTAFMLDDKPAWFKTRLNTWHGIYGPLFDYRKKFPDSSAAGVKDFAAMTRAYLSTLISVDDSVGQIYAALQKSGQLDNTLIVYVGDNGLLNGEQGMVDKRTMHEPSIRVPMVVRYPGLTPANRPQVVDKMVLHVDLAPSILDLCQAEPLANIHGHSWCKLASGQDDPAWRKSWHYEYNYEKQFPYTPNVRGVRTDRWKYIHYPHGDGQADRHMAELYDLQNDPSESRNLIGDPAQKARVAELSAELERLLIATGAQPDKMPLDEGIKAELPDLKIR